MTTVNQDIAITRGEDIEVVFAIADDLTGCIAELRLREIDGTPLATIVVDVESVIEDAGAHWEATVRIPRATTDDMAAGMYPFAVFATDSDDFTDVPDTDDVSCLAKGTLTLED